MAKAELGTKRTDPDTGKKFYDLNRDPVVSPYTGKSWPLSFFEESTAQAKMEQAEEEARSGAAIAVPQLEHALVAVLDAHLRIADHAVAAELARVPEIAPPALNVRPEGSNPEASDQV